MWKVFDKLKSLFLEFFEAIKFAAFDYDAKLQITKTPRQRFVIWSEIIIVSIIGVALFIFIIRFVANQLLLRVHYPTPFF